MAIRVHSIFWDEARFVEDMVDSVIRFVDQIIMVDGVYAAFAEVNDIKEPQSTDGTLEKVDDLKAQYPGKIVLEECSEAWANQCDKRNTIWKYCEDGDVVLVIDPDEPAWGYMGIGIRNWLKTKVDVGYVNIFSLGDTSHHPQFQWGFHPRWYKIPPGGITYKFTHWQLLDKNDKAFALHGYKWDDPRYEPGYNRTYTDSWGLCNLRGLKPKKRKEQVLRYYVWLSERGWVEPGERERLDTWTKEREEEAKEIHSQIKSINDWQEHLRKARGPKP